MRFRTGAFFFILLLWSNMFEAQNRASEGFFQALTGFQSIPDSTRTKVWWFHGETETTKTGITADLEALKSAGVGGVVYYDQTFGKMENALPGMSPGWWEGLKFAAKEAQRIGLSFETHVSNGFVAGGPWITYEHAMKRLIATETVVEGGTNQKISLALPKNRYPYVKDVVVLAFPLPEGGGKSTLNQKPVLTSNLPTLQLNALFDPTAALQKIPVQPKGQSVYINLHFPNGFEARSITYQVKAKGKATTSATNVPAPPGPIFVGTGYRTLPNLGQLEMSKDGIQYTKVCDLKPVYLAHESWNQKTISFPRVKASFFRLNLHDWSEDQDASPDMLLGNIVVQSDARLNEWEEKAGLYSEYIEKESSPAYGKRESIRFDQIIDLSDRMDAQGQLTWNVPKGTWLVMRFAQVATGGSIKHGRSNLMGLECDKLSAEAARIQFDNYFKPILDTLRSINAPVAGMVIDSHEAGAQNWTDDFLVAFKKRRGYDLTPYMPALWGRIVSDVKQTAGVLYDVRRTIADLISDRYYGTFEQCCRNEGVVLTAQATGNALCIDADPIQAKSKVSKPQGEFWILHPDGNYDIKESSSAAHLYGKKIASAEAYTGGLYSNTLDEFKNIADGAYAFGINEFVICASAYQPWGNDRLPGNVGGGWQWVFNRNNTWWNFSRNFWDYQSRSAFLLRCGQPVVDFCVYLGDNAPVKILTHRLPDIPSGYDFDAFTQDALLNRMQSANGRIVLPDGLSYAMMVLPRSGELTLAALQKIEELVRNGARIWGNRPTGSPSKIDFGREKTYEKLVQTLWDTTGVGSKNHGKGCVYWGMSLAEAVRRANVKPDLFLADGSIKDEKIYFAHRRLCDADLYFLNNHKARHQSGNFTFRTDYNNVQVWNPVRGQRYSLPVLERKDGTFTVHLAFDPQESYFILASNQTELLPPMNFAPAKKKNTFDADWQVQFNERMGGPGLVSFKQLSDWTEHSDSGIRYYSGTAVYTKNIELDESEVNEKVFIHLTMLNGLSEVVVNGINAGTVWCSPWKLELTGLLKAGLNTVEIRTTNTWTNRLIGDAGLPENKRITWTTVPIAKADGKLQKSGLLDVELLWY